MLVQNRRSLMYVQDAKKAADEAAEKEAQGAAGWFQSDNAEQAYKYLTDDSVSQYLEYTHIGAKDDATSLDNLLKALDMIDECNRLREENGLEPLKVSETAMAMAMVQANYAAQPGEEHHNHNYQYDNVGENLAWGTSDWDPYIGWYTNEKAIYDAALKSGDYPDLADLSPYDVFSKYPDLYYKVGHYLNIVNPDYIATGMAYSGYGETNYDHAFTQEYFNDWNSYNTHDTVYDAAVYRTMVENYVNQVRSAQSTYDEALKKVDEAKFEAACKHANRTAQNWLKVCDFLQYKPAPMSGFDLFNHMADVVTARGKEAAADAFELLSKDLQKNIEEGTSTLPFPEQYRVMFEGIPCWPKLPNLFKPLKENGINVTAVVYAPAFGFVYNNMDEMARAYYKAPNSVCIEQGVAWREGICRDNKVDGVLVHYNRSCKPWSGYMAEMQRRFTADLGVPCAGFDGDQADPRNFNEAQYATRVQGLVEAMEANKKD